MVTNDESGPFVLEDATIADLHAAIRAGRTTVVDVVRHYIRRARAFNGAASRLVTADGKAVAPGAGAVRAGRPLAFPSDTVAAGDVLPDLADYAGPPLEFGRMEPTASDPGVVQQFGMITGIPGGVGLNALSTLNIRGERSVTCKGDFDRHPKDGPLPPGAPPVCEHFRQLPDALETAELLDRRWGRSPDLDAMPMYGVVFSFKDPFDTKDMRSTGGGDAAYDIDFPARDHLLVEQLREKARSSSPRRCARNTTAGRVIPAGGTTRRRCCLRRSVTSARRGAAIRPTCTIRCGRRRWDRVRARAFLSPRTSAWSVSARRRGRRVGGRRTTTPSR